MNDAVTGRLAPCQLGRMVLRFAVCCLAIAAYSHATLAQLSPLHSSGRNIVNASGEIVILKGMNLGGFMVMEPWMSPDDAGGLPDTYSIIKELDSRFGVAEEQTLIKDYQQGWTSAQDFVNLKNAGINVIRVPVWWGNFWPIANVSESSWRSDAFTELDSVVSQAAAQGIYTIIDMHGLVGGQTDSDDTGEQNVMAYWTNSNDQTLSAYMWTQIAAHYNGNPNVAGYDLINEPTIGGANEPSNAQVIAAYVSLYKTVRAADSSHIVIIEACFGSSTLSALPSPASEGWTNVVYSSHEYQFNANSAKVEAGSVARVNDFINHASYNVPDFIGEWNDQGNGAATTQFSYDDYTNNGMSSAMWSYKAAKALNPNGWGMYDPSFFPPTPNVSTDSTATIASDWAQWATTNSFVLNAANGFTENVVEAPYGGTPVAIPGTVLAENYDKGGQGVGYTAISVNGTNTIVVNGTDNGYRPDGVDLETTSAPGGGNDIGWTAAGQWFRYTVNVATAGTYTITFEVASPNGVTDGFHLVDSVGTNLTGSVDVPATGGVQTWTTVTATVTLPAGQQVLTWLQDNGGFNFYSAAFSPNSCAVPSAPSGLSATAISDSQINLSWTASTAGTGCTITYSVFRSTTNGFIPSSSNQIASGVTATTYSDTALTPSTTYYYVLEAADAAGTSVESNQASAATQSGGGGGTQLIAINAGGPAVSPFVADEDFTGGGTIDHANIINTSKVTNPAPAAVYQSARVAATAGAGTTFSYTIGGFTTGSSQLVRLHFAETFHTTAGSRVFNASINGTQVLTNFDIFATAGGENIANIQQFTEPANSSGQYVLTFTSVTDKALISGIEIDSIGSCSAPTAPSGLGATATSSSQINLSWTASSSSCSVTYNVFRSTTNGFTPSSSNQIATGVSTTTFSDTGLAASTTYYYLVEGTNSGGTSAASNQANATTSASSGSCTSICIDSGSTTAVSPFVADEDFTGGGTINHANTINTSKVTNPAPAAVYQTARVTTTVGAGTTFSYTIGGFAANSSHIVRLHFAETFHTTAGSRVFNVSINGTQVLTNFDIFATAGGENIANIQQFTENANASGQYVLTFTSDTDKALISGIEID
jgi:endoglucanase